LERSLATGRLIAVPVEKRRYWKVGVAGPLAGRAGGNSVTVIRGQERLFERGEMPVSVRAFVRTRLEGFALRQAARAEKRKQQRLPRAFTVKPDADETQAWFGFEMTPEGRASDYCFVEGLSNC